ncbi:MFS transporter [Fulvivirgaceae bacterium BMA10]|uniref:MFS transporter n=1 Tax=Splendidivirga corallicola TaxID=3051826 RepID=A0ABT8KP28_9BACT|nr:MFS transporter [Fulvivirgaceae bacterium BMA10]
MIDKLTSSKKSNYLIIAALWLLMFSSSSQFFIIAPILPELSTQLNIPEQLGGTLVSAYAINLAVFALFAGLISDRKGRRKILLLGSGTMTLSLALHSVAFDYWSMVFVRSLTGISGGLLTGSCIAYVSDYFPRNKRGWANGMIATGSAVGQILGIPAGTLMAQNYGFYTPFMLFAATMAISFVMIYFFVHEPKTYHKREKLKIKTFFNEYRKVARKLNFKIIAGAYFMMFLSITVFIVYYPTFLINQCQFNSNSIAMLFLLGGIATVVSGPLSGKISDIIDRKYTLLFSNAILALLMLLPVFDQFRGFSLTYMFFMMLMFFVSARMVPFQSMASEIVSNHSRGKFLCLSIAVGQGGMALGAGLSGFLFSSYGFWANSLVAFIACALMGLIILLVPSTGRIRSKLLLDKVMVWFGGN